LSPAMRPDRLSSLSCDPSSGPVAACSQDEIRRGSTLRRLIVVLGGLGVLWAISLLMHSSSAAAATPTPPPPTLAHALNSTTTQALGPVDAISTQASATAVQTLDAAAGTPVLAHTPVLAGTVPAVAHAVAVVSAAGHQLTSTVGSVVGAVTADLPVVAPVRVPVAPGHAPAAASSAQTGKTPYLAEVSAPTPAVVIATVPGSNPRSATEFAAPTATGHSSPRTPAAYGGPAAGAGQPFGPATPSAPVPDAPGTPAAPCSPSAPMSGNSVAGLDNLAVHSSVRYSADLGSALRQAAAAAAVRPSPSDDPAFSPD
jgi:hypothetical protein